MEIIAGEEQRAYIDMLKNQMEKRIIELGLNYIKQPNSKGTSRSKNR